MILLVLSILYAVLVAADVWISLWAVKHGTGKEKNFMMKPFIKTPVILVGLEIGLFAIVVFVGSYYWQISVFGVIARTLILINNINVIRRKR